MLGGADCVGDSSKEEAWAPLCRWTVLGSGPGEKPAGEAAAVPGLGAKAHKLGCNCSGQAFLRGWAETIYTSCRARSTPQEAWAAGSGALGRA